MNKSGNLLIIDDDEDVLQAARLVLKNHFDSIVIEADPKLIPSLMKENRFDALLMDMNFTQDVNSGEEGFYWLDTILELDSSASVVLITGYGDVEMAVKAIKHGALDFITKPWQNDKLIATMNSAVALSRSKKEAQNFRSKVGALNEQADSPFREIIGSSSAIQSVFKTIEKVAKTDANVLILGENGTGKELVARALHRQSARAKSIFVSVDMGAISESLFESELFGHKKGAFTDAKEDRLGRLEVASGGTLFLDEIGNLSLPLQAKLLTVLQHRKVTPLGSHKEIPFDVRLITATNLNLEEMVSDGSFRQDLMYRINTIEIHLPPLRERVDDIEELAIHFLKKYRHRYHKPISGISENALEKLKSYLWPGNIRELEHAIQRAIILSDNEQLQAHDFSLNTKTTNADSNQFESYDLDEVEKSVIKKVLSKNRGNISHAAKELGITRAALYRRMDKHGL